MKKIVAILAVTAFMFSMNVNAQEKKKATAEKAKTEKTCSTAEKKSCGSEKKGGCCSAKKTKENK